MLQESPKMRGLKKTKAGKKTSSALPYAKSRTKKLAKAEPQVSPLSYPQKTGYAY